MRHRIIVMCVFLSSCINEGGIVNSKSYEVCLKQFCITFSNNYRVDIKGNNDEYEGFMVSENKDTIVYKFGFYINKLTELEPDVIYFPGPATSLEGIDETRQVVTNKLNYDIDHFKKQNVFFDTIDGFPAKIVMPRVHGKGITGVYIDSLAENDLAENYSFYLFVRDLSKEDEEYLISSIRSLRFKNPIRVPEQYGIPSEVPK